jgi:hypothetical protein
MMCGDQQTLNCQGPARKSYFLNLKVTSGLQVPIFSFEQFFTTQS